MPENPPVDEHAALADMIDTLDGALGAAGGSVTPEYSARTLAPASGDSPALVRVTVAHAFRFGKASFLSPSGRRSFTFPASAGRDRPAPSRPDPTCLSHLSHFSPSPLSPQATPSPPAREDRGSAHLSRHPRCRPRACQSHRAEDLAEERRGLSPRLPPRLRGLSPRLPPRRLQSRRHPCLLRPLPSAASGVKSRRATSPPPRLPAPRPPTRSHARSPRPAPPHLDESGVRLPR